MARFDNTYDFEDDYIGELRVARREREELVMRTQHDLAAAARGLGQTGGQIRTKVDSLFSTFASEWSIYILVGSTAIIDAIQNDATLPWLDTDVSGTSIRQRLINRLS